MKANEIIPGAWLRLRYTKNGKEIVKDFQVDQIRRLATDSEDVYVWSRDSGNMGLVGKMEPIPLTPEILEKNGFEKYGPYLMNLQQWITVVNGRKVSIFQEGENEWHFNGTWINYVHQFQRLCVIDLKIKL